MSLERSTKYVTESLKLDEQERLEESSLDSQAIELIEDCRRQFQHGLMTEKTWASKRCAFMKAHKRIWRNPQPYSVSGQFRVEVRKQILLLEHLVAGLDAYVKGIEEVGHPLISLRQAQVDEILRSFLKSLSEDFSSSPYFGHDLHAKLRPENCLESLMEQLHELVACLDYWIKAEIHPADLVLDFQQDCLMVLATPSLARPPNLHAINSSSVDLCNFLNRLDFLIDQLLYPLAYNIEVFSRQSAKQLGDLYHQHNKLFLPWWEQYHIESLIEKNISYPLDSSEPNQAENTALQQAVIAYASLLFPGQVAKIVAFIIELDSKARRSQMKDEQELLFINYYRKEFWALMEADKEKPQRLLYDQRRYHFISLTKPKVWSRIIAGL